MVKDRTEYRYREHSRLKSVALFARICRIEQVTKFGTEQTSKDIYDRSLSYLSIGVFRIG